VVDVHGSAPPGPNIVPGPQLAEARAGKGELADELDEAGIVGVGADGLANAGR
jgi:hypothetical protein